MGRAEAQWAAVEVVGEEQVRRGCVKEWEE